MPRHAEPTPVATFMIDALEVRVFATASELATAAAASTALAMREVSAHARDIAVVFASAPSQLAFLARLAEHPDVPWATTVAFHLDEYAGLSRESSASFGHFLERHLFARVPLADALYLDGTAPSLEDECRRYATLLERHPLAVACIGIGENGHIAFNEPDSTDFHDERLVRVVQLDDVSRHQQVRDGCFGHVEDVPLEAMTLTVPAIMAATTIRCVVPGAHKAGAVARALDGPISPSCPASVLRRHPDAILFVDGAAASALELEATAR